MELSEILNLILGGGLAATLIALITVKATLRKANAEAEKARAEADTVKITNTEQATRILMQSIVEPLKEELNETRKDLNATKREMARLRKAIDDANNCKFSDDCPVLRRMRYQPKERDIICGENINTGQRTAFRPGHRKRCDRKDEASGDGTDVDGESDDSDRQHQFPANRG